MLVTGLFNSSTSFIVEAGVLTPTVILGIECCCIIPDQIKGLLLDTKVPAGGRQGNCQKGWQPQKTAMSSNVSQLAFCKDSGAWTVLTQPYSQVFKKDELELCLPSLKIQNVPTKGGLDP